MQDFTATPRPKIKKKSISSLVRRKFRSIEKLYFNKWVSKRRSLTGLDLSQKRVMILGPARTVDEDLTDYDLRSFDIVVKMNNGLYTSVEKMYPHPLRCDILFHSLSIHARPVTSDKLQRAGVSLMVHRAEYPSHWADTYDAMVKLRRDPVLKRKVGLSVVSHRNYKRLSKQIQGYSPTTGLVCIDAFMQMDVKELAIVGFSFYRTRYTHGYDDADLTKENDITPSNRHDHAPSLEAAYLAEAIKKRCSEGANISLGKNVSGILYDKAAPYHTAITG